MKKILAAAGLVAAASGALATTAEGTTTARASSLDATFLKSAIQGDRFEIEGGTRAASSGNAAVRTLAARLVKDHTRSLKEATKLARRLGVDVPETPTPPERWELRIVGALQGAAFDRWYPDLEVARPPAGHLRSQGRGVARRQSGGAGDGASRAAGAARAPRDREGGAEESLTQRGPNDQHRGLNAR
jgi:predicted outer membrane protein